MDILRAQAGDLEAVVPLFDGYRQFYGFAPDLEAARAFLAERVERGDSVIFLAMSDGRAVGFTQLYPSFSSGRMKRIYILNDLFVSPAARGLGSGRALLGAARAFAKGEGAARLTLSTAVGNATAQALYVANGWERENDYWTYNLTL